MEVSRRRRDCGRGGETSVRDAVSTILLIRTKDTVTEGASRRLLVRADASGDFETHSAINQFDGRVPGTFDQPKAAPDGAFGHLIAWMVLIHPHAYGFNLELRGTLGRAPRGVFPDDLDLLLREDKETVPLPDYPGTGL
jgi:hypothetical protein